MSDSSTTDDHDVERKAKLEEFYFQRRFLFGCTVALFCALIMWFTAISSTNWYRVDGGTGIFIVGNRRYFKYSQTGIWRTCRKYYNPVPAASFIVRNYTKIGYTIQKTDLEREKLKEKDFIKEFLKIKLKPLDTIEEIDEDFRKYMFAQFISQKEKTPQYAELTAKFRSLKPKHEAKRVKFLNPANLDEVTENVGDFVREMKWNESHTGNFVISSDLKFALYEGWEENGINVVRMLNYYGKTLRIDNNIFKGDEKFLFQPPAPQKKPYNGFVYEIRRDCTLTNLFAKPDAEAIAENPSLDETLLELSRNCATFTIFTLFLMVLGFIFTCYTFLNPRYMFKRLAGGVHFISGATSAIVCRVMTLSYEHSAENLTHAFPRGSQIDFGYAYFFAIFVSAINFFSCLTFLWYSKKKKGSKAATEELGMADEPINIGR